MHSAICCSVVVDDRLFTGRDKGAIHVYDILSTECKHELQGPDSLVVGRRWLSSECRLSAGAGESR